MSPWEQHLVVVPVVLPLAVAAAMLLVDERRYALKAAIAVVSMLALLIAAATLATLVDAPSARVYRLGAWPADFGIVLVADRLSALMVLLASVLGLCALLFSLARWHRAGPRFHTLLQVLMAGVNGAFLTGDLFNLFVFFEVFLAASYGLALHGSGTARVQASLHYIVINLTASLLFLIGASLLYAVTGTLNLADLALRIPAVPAGDRALLEAGAALLGIAFLVKAGMWPLCFWLPATYGNSSAPAAALFALLTKVGIYVVLRIWLLFFSEGSGASAGFGQTWLMAGGMATLVFGILGVVGSRELARVAGYSLLVSSGTLLTAIGVGEAGVSAAALYYLVCSTLGVSAFFLIIELVERTRMPGADLLEVTREAFGSFEAETGDKEEVGVAIPAAWAALGIAFGCCGVLLAGLPPLAGFVAKLALLDALLAPSPVSAVSGWMLALLMLAGLATVIAFSRAGVRIFWAAHEDSVPRVRVVEMLPIVFLLSVAAALTVLAGPAMRYLNDAAQALHAPRGYMEDVLKR